MKKLIVLICLALGAAYYYHYLDSLADGMGLSTSGSSSSSAVESEEETASKGIAESDPLLNAVLGDDAATSGSDGRDAGGRVSTQQHLTIRVVHSESKEVIEGANIYFLVSSDVDAEGLDSMGADRVDIDAIFKRFGQLAVSNAEGEAQFEWDGESGGAFAEMESMRSEFEATDGIDGKILILQMQEEKGVAVQVIDESGNPVLGVPVAMHVLAKAFSGPDLEMTVVTRPTEGIDGIARFSGVMGLMKFDSDPDPKYSVRIEVPGIMTESHPVTDGGDLNDPMVLVLPAYGPLEVRTYSSKGEPLSMAGRVTLTAPNPMEEDAEEMRLTKPLVDGVAEFPFIGLNSKVRVKVESKSMGVVWETSGHGPTSSSETGLVKVFATNAPVVVGRIMDKDGNAQANSPWMIYFLREDRAWLHQAACRTDEAGRFRVELPQKLTVGKKVGIMLTSSHSMIAKSRADLDGLLTIESGEMDLGDFVPRDVQSSISGRCVDPQGNPLAKIQVSFQQDFGRGMGTADWTDKNGEFTIYGIYPAQTMLEIQPSEWVLPAPMLIPVDGSEVEVVLYRAGKIAGKVAMSSEKRNPKMVINATLSTPGAIDTVDWMGSCPVDPEDGSFSLEHLPPGEYSLKLSGIPSPVLATITGIDVSLAATTVDPRINPWNYQTDLHTAKFRVVDSQGRAVDHPALEVFYEGKQTATARREGATLECTYGNASESTMVVTASGCRPVVLRGKVLDSVITLERGIAVTLSAQNRPSLKSGEKSASMSLQWQNADPLLKATGDIGIPHELLTSGQCQVVFPGPGSYRLAVSISQPAGNGVFMASIGEPLLGIPAIHIVEASAGSQVEIKLPESFFAD